TARRRDSGRLVIAGDGPARAALEGQAASLGLRPPRVVFTGWQSQSEIRALIANARCVVLPSVCFETFGNTIVEAFAHGRAAIVSGIGAPAEIVRSGGTGLTVRAGSEAALADALDAILADGSTADRYGATARSEYLARYTPELNYLRLMSIYRFAVARRNGATRETVRSVGAPAAAA